MAFQLLPEFAGYRVPDYHAIVEATGKNVPPTVRPPEVEDLFSVACQDSVLSPVFLGFRRAEADVLDLLLSEHNFGVVRCCRDIQAIFRKSHAVNCL